MRMKLVGAIIAPTGFKLNLTKHFIPQYYLTIDLQKIAENKY